MSNGDSPIKASPESLYTQAIADSQASSSMSNNQSSNQSSRNIFDLSPGIAAAT